MVASTSVLAGVVYVDIDCMTNRNLSNFAELRVCHEFEPDDTATGDDECNNTGGNGGGGSGMIQATVQSMLVSLALKDTPLSYRPAKGPAVPLSFTYSQKEAYQPATFTYSNVGPKWNYTGIAYIVDDPAVAGRNVQRYMAGGGTRKYRQADFNATTQTFAPDATDMSVLVRVSSSPVKYERRLADGGVETYAFPDGQTASPRKVFLTEQRDPFGNVLRYQYDQAGRLASLIDATGKTTRLEYGHSDPLKITAIADPFGRRAQIGYDAAGRLASITDALGLTSQVVYRGTGTFVEAVITPYGTTRFDYGETSSTRWIEITDPQGHTERVENNYNAPGIANSESRAPTGLNVANWGMRLRNTYYWDATSYAKHKGDYTKAVIKHWLAVDEQTIPVLESIKRPLESRIWYNYPGQSDAFRGGSCNRPSAIARVLPDGTTQLTTITRNDKGNPLVETDPLSRETRYEYAPNGIDLTRVQQKTATGYDTLIQITWNSQHRPLTVKDAAGRTTSYAYNSAGQLTSQTNALNQTTQYQYNNDGRLIRVINPLGRTEASYSYDAYGNLATETDSEGHTLTHQYDALDRRTKTIYPDGTTTEFNWDKLDLVSVKDRNGKLGQYQYDAARRLIGFKDALRAVQFGYTESGGLISPTDGNGNVTQWARDIQGRVITKLTPDGVQNRYDYDSAGRPSAHTDAAGQTRTLTYSRDDRVTRVAYANTANPTPAVSFTWDAYYPRVSEMTDATGKTTYSYVRAGMPGALKLLGETGPFKNAFHSFSYDALGRAQSWFIGGGGETYTFDALGRITGNRNSLLGAFKYEYLGDTGQLTSRMLTGTPIQSTYAYEPNAGDWRLKSIAHPQAARSFSYLSAPEGLIRQQTETVQGQSKTWQYGYDAIDRLESASHSDLQYGYTLDKADNITRILAPEGTRAYQHDAGNKINQHPYRYDGNGNRVEDERHTYSWDAENRLIKIAYKATPQKGTEFRYDGLGRRVAVIETDGANKAETRFGWCGDRICQARDGSDQPLAYYFHEGAARPPEGNRKEYYARDHLGSVRDVLDGAGNAVARYDYDPYGKLINAPANMPTFGYAGMLYHAPSGLYLTKYRAYDPESGRWLTRDPIEEEGGINLYAYVQGNPVSYIDPTGLWANIAINLGIRTFGGRAAAASIGAAARRYGLGGRVAACILAGMCVFNEETKTPNEGEPGSCHLNPGSGQERKYGSDGKPEYDIDWDHDHGQGVPHGHNWDNGKRGPGVPVSSWPQGRKP